MSELSVSALAATLQARIHNGEFPVGTWLRQETLGRELGVSRTPMRHALEQLSAQGLVELIPNRGARVRAPSEREIVEAYAVRAVLEGYAAELASELISSNQLERLEAADELFENAVAAARSNGLTTDWAAANDAFHEAIQEAACNEHLRATIRGVHHSFPRNLTESALRDDLRQLERNVAEHAAIRAAIEARDPRRARRLMISHVESSGRLVALRASGPERS